MLGITCPPRRAGQDGPDARGRYHQPATSVLDMGLFGTKKQAPEIDRTQSLAARPALNDLISFERNSRGLTVLHMPRRRTGMVRVVAKAFRLPPYKQIELDELGSYTLELCDGSHSVGEMVRLFAGEFKLNRREAEVSMLSYLQSLAKRGIISFAVPQKGVKP